MDVTHILEVTLSGDPDDAATSMVLAIEPDPVCLGAEATLTATVTAVDGEATGTVDFYEGETFLGNATLVDGVATLFLDTFTLGDHTVTAYYNGDDTHDACQAEATVEVIDDPDICHVIPPVNECGFTNPSDGCTVPCTEFQTCGTALFQNE